MASKKQRENSKKQAAASKKQNKTARSVPMRIPRSRSGMDGGFGGSLPAQAAAAAYAKGARSGPPRVRGSFRSTRIQHRELIGSVVGTSAFTVGASYALNPGLAATFPWLSTQALGWEQYKFHKLKFCYYSRCATSTAGSMMLVPDYDAADSAPSTEQIASDYEEAIETVPWVMEVCCNLDPRAMAEPGDRKYVRTAALASNLDVKTYDAGTMFVCTVDGSSTNWGKLWVEYDVEFFKPQLPPGGVSQTDLIVSGGGNVSNTTIFGSVPTYLSSGNTTTSYAIANGNANTMVFNQPGYYLVIAQVIGSSSPALSVSVNTSSMVLTAYSASSNSTSYTLDSLIKVDSPLNPVEEAITTYTCTNTVTSSTVAIIPLSQAQYTALGGS